MHEESVHACPLAFQNSRRPVGKQMDSATRERTTPVQIAFDKQDSFLHVALLVTHR